MCLVKHSLQTSLVVIRKASLQNRPAEYAQLWRTITRAALRTSTNSAEAPPAVPIAALSSGAPEHVPIKVSPKHQAWPGRAAAKRSGTSGCDCPQS